MALEIIRYTKDCRTQTDVLYATIPIGEYLELVGSDFDRFEIQRKRQDPKKYTRLKEDIRKGTLLPGITLAVNPGKVSDYKADLEQKNSESLIHQLKEKDDLYILDGLQRTYIINDLTKEGATFQLDQNILLEIWFEDRIEHLIYRLIVLNSGQKPMSMKHQVELLFTTLKSEIEAEIPDLIIYVERDGQIRSRELKFSFDRLVNAYYSFLTKSPEVKRDNLVVKKLNEDDILSANEEELNLSYNSFIDFLKMYCLLDKNLYPYYQNNDDSNKNWLAEENNMKGVFAAIGRYGVDEKRMTRIKTALEKLVVLTVASPITEDPLGLDVYKEVKSGIDSKKYNVGSETRRLVMDGFREYFMDEGDTPFTDCWKNAAR